MRVYQSDDDDEKDEDDPCSGCSEKEYGGCMGPGCGHQNCSSGLC